MGKKHYSPKGFKTAGVHCGIKEARKLDLALIVSECDCTAAGTFTRNTFRSPSVDVSEHNVRTSPIRAIIANSGNANACTGENGLKNARLTTQLLATELGINQSKVFVCSTGIIGVPLNMHAIGKGVISGVKKLSSDNWEKPARAIMTTDTFPKISSTRFKVDGKTVNMIGIAKGAGMIHPNMATMLCFIATDCAIAKRAIGNALRIAVNRSFNCISVDGDTSTNDSVIALANGMAGNRKIITSGKALDMFSRHLEKICLDLAKMIPEDGEGATKLIEILVEGAKSDGEAKTAAMGIATSTLFKTAMFGNDPNWGRILAAIGNTDVAVNKEKSIVWIGKTVVFKHNAPAWFDAANLSGFLSKNKEIRIKVNLAAGKGTCTVWTCDLSDEYVRFNADYHT